MKGRRKRRLWAGVTVLALCAAAAGGWHHGWWGQTPSPWTKATGWDRVPPGLRPPARPAAEPGPRLSWLGHSGFLIEWAGARILLDPNLSDWCTVVRRSMERPAGPEDLPPVDATLLSHAHYDHMDMPTLRALPDPGAVILPAGDETYFRREPWSTDRLRPLSIGHQTAVGAIEITAVATAHNGSRRHPWRSRKLAVGYILRGPDATLYYPGDTSFAADFAGIREEFRPTMAILPIGCYAPRFPLKIHHLSPEEAARAGQILGVERVVPCHFGTFALTLDRPAAALPRFARAAAALQMDWRMPVLYQPPESASP